MKVKSQEKTQRTLSASRVLSCDHSSGPEEGKGVFHNNDTYVTPLGRLFLPRDRETKGTRGDTPSASGGVWEIGCGQSAVKGEGLFSAEIASVVASLEKATCSQT